MIRKIGLDNFKAFKKLDSINIAPLTVVMGKNSSGKSSILHSLLLLKQTAESRNRDVALALDGKYLRYSNLSEIVYGLPESEDAKLSFNIEISMDKVYMPIQIGIKNQSEDGKTFHPVIDFLKYKSSSDHVLDLNNLGNEKVKKNPHLKLNPFLKDHFGDSVARVSFDKFFPEFMSFDLSLPGKKKNTVALSRVNKVPFGFVFSHGECFEVLRRSLENLRYLSPLRATPQRAYIHYSDDAFELNEDGSNSAHILWAKSQQSVSWCGRTLKLTDAVNECIQCVGLQQKIKPSRTGQITYQINVDIPTLGKDVTVADVGFGYSQIIPIVLTGLLNGEENLMMIEQPEIHLHPSSCANLADLFLGFIQDKRRFIIETHSQDFINRLRLRVIEDPTLKDKINIVFIDESIEGHATARQFQIDENGSFPEWPNGFIDESEKGARAIIKARSNRNAIAKEAKPVA
jgi:predicted ATPase